MRSIAIRNRIIMMMMLTMMLVLSMAAIVHAGGSFDSFLSTKSSSTTATSNVISAFTTIPLTTTRRRKLHETIPTQFPLTKQQQQQQRISFFLPILQSTTTDESTTTTTSTTSTDSSSSQPQPKQKYSQYKPRQGLAQSLLNLMLSSPLWNTILVPQARNTMVKTAEANGIPWMTCLHWLQKQDGPWNNSNEKMEENFKYPDYYKKSFHAYSTGNLNWDAALEQEIASCSVGARNFPMYGYKGENMFRSSFDVALSKLGAAVCDDGVVLDLGCGTGTSTRRLAELYPHAKEIVGMDLSPYMVSVGKRLLDLAPSCIMAEVEKKGEENGKEGLGDTGTWVNTITPDDRITLTTGDAADTKLPNESVDVVNLNLVIHELPSSVAASVVREAHRILKQDGGQLWISEMDFESPAYAKQRSNALLFSLLRATEPYLDEYADGFQHLLYEVVAREFDVVRIGAATGRHYSLVAIKKGDGTKKGGEELAVVEDTRFNSDGSYALDDTHLNLWESKKVDA